MLTVLPDFREEGWHSMDLCADMLVKHAPADTHFEVCQPAYQKRFGWLPGKRCENFDRWHNRWRVYPRFLKKLIPRDGFYHLVDHSYSHLLHYLPEGKVGVYCHDLDAFRSVLQPDQEPRPAWYRKMMGRVLEGFKKACLVFCSTEVTRQQLLQWHHWESDAIRVVPYGVAEEFIPTGNHEPGDFLLHVGSCIPRKRIDLLLEVVAAVRKQIPAVRLIQAGGQLTSEQQALVGQLGLSSVVEQRRGLSRLDLARLYRGAKMLLVTSDAEGFGLPVIEALACGTTVLASDIPTLREAGGDGARYVSPGIVEEWSTCVQEILAQAIFAPSIEKKTSQAAKYSWFRHCQMIADGYKALKG
jgi:glycosyltransferase involved in cell wall biosynthesis